MGLKNRALWAPIFYPVRAGWLAETFVRMLSEGAPPARPASAVARFRFLSYGNLYFYRLNGLQDVFVRRYNRCI